LAQQICFVIPTKNEEPGIVPLLEQIRETVAPLKYSLAEIILVDDSQDRTAEKARGAGARVLAGGHRGLGYAMWLGLKKALESQADVIVTLDGDGQANLQDIEKFVEPIVQNQADLVIASRFLGKDGISYPYPFINRLGVFLLSRFLRFRTGLPITDSHGGIRAMSPQVAESLEMIGTHTYVQETVLDAFEKGFRIKEIPSAWKPRIHGTSRVVNSIWLYIIRCLPVLLSRSPGSKICLVLGGLFMALGPTRFLGLASLFLAAFLEWNKRYRWAHSPMLERPHFGK